MSQDVLDESIERAGAAAAAIPGVVAVSLGGSFAFGMADEWSDIDLHVYWRAPLASDAERAAVLATVADPGSIRAGIHDWGLEDHFAIQGRLAELVYVHLDDLAESVDTAYDAGLGDEGFATAQLTYVAASRVLHDREGALAALRARLAIYPEATRRRLLASLPNLLNVYLEQLRKAQARGDLLYVQHRRYTLQMVFFNLLFALNRRYHPGEKRLLLHTETCPLRPHECAARWMRVSRLPADDPALAELLASLVGDIRHLVERDTQ